MGFYKNGRWQPDATEIASGEYRIMSVEDSLRRRIAELEARELGYIQSLRELEAELDAFRNGYKGSCYACEIVGEKNAELRERIAELKRRALEVIESWELYRDNVSEDASDYDMMEDGVRQLKELMEEEQ